MSLFVDIRKQLGDFLLQVRLETDSITAILGPSGCGKSMTLKCIAGVETPDSGKIVLNERTLFDSEKKINVKPQERRVGYLFQNYALFPNMTVRQNILCGLHREKDKSRKEDVLRKMIRLMGLEGTEDRFPSQISGGQQQRTALARILVSDPEAILLDEPFSALDTHLREKLMVDMREILIGFGGIAVEVTHNRNEAYYLCDSTALMDNGEIVAHANSRELFADPGSVIAAKMTGCKNIQAAEYVDDHTVFVPAWGIRLESEHVRKDVKAVGIRAHSFRDSLEDNRNPIRVLSRFEEPFEETLVFRFNSQDGDSPDLWWKTQKGRQPLADRAEIGVLPSDILLLYS